MLIRTFALMAMCIGTLSAPAVANSLRYLTPPPVVLSPDLAQPWAAQLDPGIISQWEAPLQRRARLPVGDAQPSATVAPTNGKTAKARKPDPRFLPAVVSFDGAEPPGTVVIDTNERYLYLVEADGKARRYGVGVGRPGFEWAGVHTVTRKAEWPDWWPPEEMRARQPELPAMMAGGPQNPLGARALYLGSTLYRIHGTSEPWTIGQAVSSGCIRMRNEDVIDLYERVPVGARVVVI
jgi:lipoprotein-anchoring transpeptidase ErfK/SrfK